MPDNKELTPQQRGAVIRNSGIYPLVGKIEPIEILRRYERGEKIVDIARSLDCSHKAVYRHLLAHVPDEWREYQSAHAMEQHRAALEVMESATEPLDIARARELVRDAQWQLERLQKRLYGNQPEQAAQGTIAIQINFSRPGSELNAQDPSRD